MLVDSGLERFFLCFHSVQGVSGALTVLKRDAIKPNLMQTLEVGGGYRAGGAELYWPGDWRRGKQSSVGKWVLDLFNWLG